MLWTTACVVRAFYVFSACAIMNSGKTESYGTNSVIDEEYSVGSKRETCRIQKEPTGSKYKCHLEPNATSSDLPDAYLNVVSIASITDAHVIASVFRSSQLQSYQTMQRDIDGDRDNLAVNYELVSDVLSCSVHQNLTVRSAEVTFSIKLGQFVHNQPENANFVRENALCVFWDNHSSKWSTWGCSRDFGDSSPSYITCNCNHTTSFAIIAPMEKYDPLGKEAIGIRVPTYTACLISIIVQGAVIWHIVKLRNLVKDYDYVFAICNLLGASIGTTATLACSIEFSRFKIPCTISGIFMHFFYTATLAWLATEGVHYYLKIKGKTIEEGYTNKRYYSAFGWALPAALVGIFVGVHRGYGKHDRCLLTSYSGILSAFIFSAVLFLSVKSILLLVAMRGYKDSRTVKYKNVFVKIRRCVVESVFLIPYLGVIWVFGMTSHICYAVQILFYVLFALQGLVLSIYCYFTKEIELARGRSTRQGLLRLRSLSKQGLVFGRVPLEEVASPIETDVHIELGEIEKQMQADRDDDNSENTPAAKDDGTTFKRSITSINQETTPDDIKLSEAEANDTETVLLHEENLSEKKS